MVVQAVQQPHAAAPAAAGRVKKPRRSRRGELPTRCSARQLEKKQKAAEAQARLCLQELGIVPQQQDPAIVLPQAAPQVPAGQLPADDQDEIMNDVGDDVRFFAFFIIIYYISYYFHIFCQRSYLRN